MTILTTYLVFYLVTRTVIALSIKINFNFFGQTVRQWLTLDEDSHYTPGKHALTYLLCPFMGDLAILIMFFGICVLLLQNFSSFLYSYLVK